MYLRFLSFIIVIALFRATKKNMTKVSNRSKFKIRKKKLTGLGTHENDVIMLLCSIQICIQFDFKLIHTRSTCEIDLNFINFSYRNVFFVYTLFIILIAETYE